MNKTILIVIDNNINNVNGVVTTFLETSRVLRERGFDVIWLTPSDFKTIPCPGYPEVRLAINPWKVSYYIEKYNPDYIHIATEGPIGFFAMLHCEKKKYNFTSSYHTKTPEYIKSRIKLFPLELGYWFLRRLHKNSKRTLVTTESMKNELIEREFKNLIVWGRGVNTTIFNDSSRKKSNINRLLYVGRISKEKNIEEFLNLNLNAEKIVVGDGPQRKELEEKYPNVRFVGYKHGAELAEYYSNAEVFVFPSYTDTFGIVMLEAIACGTPVVAHDVTGPKDCILNGKSGILSDDLNCAVCKAMLLDRENIKQIGQMNTWDKCTDIFQNNLVKKQ